MTIFQTAVDQSIPILDKFDEIIEGIERAQSLADFGCFTKIGEKVVEHRARKYGTTKFGLERFINGFLDLLSITFVGKFGRRPMHFFGAFGTLMFVVGFCSALYLGINKLVALSQGMKAPLVTSNPWFFIALTTMILGTMLFLAGFLAELIARNSPTRNAYLIEKEI